MKMSILLVKSKLKSAEKHLTTAFSRIFMRFGLLQNVENMNLKSGGLWPSPLRWGNLLQCYSPFWGVTMFWKDQLWRTQLPQACCITTGEYSRASRGSTTLPALNGCVCVASTYCEFGKDFPGQSLLFLDYWVLLLLPRILRVVVVRKPREWTLMRERSMI